MKGEITTNSRVEVREVVGLCPTLCWSADSPSDRQAAAHHRAHEGHLPAGHDYRIANLPGASTREGHVGPRDERLPDAHALPHLPCWPGLPPPGNLSSV